MLWQDVEREQRLVGQVGYGRQPTDRGDVRFRPGRDHDPRRRQAAIACEQDLAVNEAGPAADDLDSHPLETLLRIVRCNRGDSAADMRADSGPVYGRGCADAEPRAVTRALRPARRREQRLRRHAAGVETFAAHLPRFDQRDLQSEHRAAPGCGQPQPIQHRSRSGRSVRSSSGYVCTDAGVAPSGGGCEF